MTCAAISISGFFLRGIWMLQDSPWLQHRLVKISPHIIDTLLLVSGISLAVITRQNPLIYHWLLVKLSLLLAYIILGSVALKYGRNKKQRGLAFSGALICFILIVYVARNRHTLPF